MPSVKSSKINITDVDFDDISLNLKEYLQGQEILKDYDFEGSTLSTLIDLMAYASHISAFNTNLAASELFLDSAQIRKNVVSRAKDLGFTPSSVTGATASFDLSLRNVLSADGSIPSANSMVLARGTRFSTSYDGSTYEFVCTSSVTPSQNNRTFNYSNIQVKQGVYITDIYVFDNQIKNPKFVLSNQRADIQTIDVSINSDGTSTSWSKAGDLSSILTTSKVYFTQENEDGFTEIYFGDNTIGATPLDGDIITVTYINIDEIHANGANQFSLLQSINGFSDSQVSNVTKAAGGSESESIESIKFKASKSYASQNRLVTLNDYKAKVQEYYPNADAVAVWGGEDNDPPDFGKVYISLKPLNSDYLSETEKDVVKSKLRDLNMLTVRPVIVDPSIVDIVLNTTFKYNPRTSTVSLGELESLVRNTIIDFDADNLNGFDAIFRHSNLSKAIDESNDSILSNITTVKLKSKTVPELNVSKGYTIKFGNTLYNPHSGHNAASGGILSSTGFKVSGDSVNTQYFDDDGNGNLRRYYFSGSTRVYTDSQAGTVNYSTGTITVNGINFTSVVNLDSTIEFTVIPNSNDVTSTRGQLIDIKSANITVSGESDTIASGESSAGVGYVTPSSYS